MVDTVSVEERLLVQIASYNTNLQGVNGLPQDLVDWLAPTLQVSTFLSPQRRAPDIVAVGFQELLPLHLGLSGFSKAVIRDRNNLILSQIEKHAPNKERYSLIASVVNVGVALLVYGRDDGVARRVCDVHTQWVGCGPGYMGNKGAVGVRFRLPGDGEDVGEIYTFVCAHLSAHDGKVAQRIDDYNHIVSRLLFPSVTPESKGPSTIFSTSHLFFFGDLNFRLELPTSHPLSAIWATPEFAGALAQETTREELKEHDQLLTQVRKGQVFIGLHEGEFWRFQCSYKYELGEVNKYSQKRIPSWTDRILYATSTDQPDVPYEHSNITNLLYTSIPSYTTSDHKPIVALLLLPPRTMLTAGEPPMIKLAPGYQLTPDPLAVFKRYIGRSLGRLIGICWWALTVVGAGSAVFGLVNFTLGFGAWKWWKGGSPAPSPV